MKKRLHLSIPALITALLLAAAPATAGSPTDAIRSAIDRGVEILKTAKTEKPKDRQQVIAKLREIVYPVFDFEEMARRSLGPHWRAATPEQQREFVSAFTELLETTYADRIDLYEGQQVEFVGETIDNGYAEVNTRVIGKNQTYSVNYRLHLVDGQWKIYDIVAENISMVSNYRSQFNRIVVKSSVEDLIKKIRQTAK